MTEQVCTVERLTFKKIDEVCASLWLGSFWTHLKVSTLAWISPIFLDGDSENLSLDNPVHGTEESYREAFQDLLNTTNGGEMFEYITHSASGKRSNYLVSNQGRFYSFTTNQFIIGSRRNSPTLMVTLDGVLYNIKSSITTSQPRQTWRVSSGRVTKMTRSFSMVYNCQTIAVSKQMESWYLYITTVDICNFLIMAGLLKSIAYAPLLGFPARCQIFARWWII